MTEMGKPWYLRVRRSRWQHFRAIPWKRLWLLLTAVFLLFTVVGWFYDLLTLGTMPYAVVALVAIFSGLDAVLWIVVLSRLPAISLVPLIALQVASGPMISWTVKWMGQFVPITPVPETTGVRVAGSAVMATVVVSYVFFVRYMRAEGRESFRMRNELELAHGIQKTLVPPVTVRTASFEVYGISQPSAEVGGDLVDAVMLPNGDLVAYLADIAGHGLAAGILMGMLKTAARTALLDAADEHPAVTLPRLLERLNRVLPAVKEPQMYATLTAFRLNADGGAWMAMAASPPVLHWSPQRRDLQLVERAQFPVGLLPVTEFPGERLDVAPGDLLVVATDGVLEVCDRNEEEFGIERLEQVIAANAGKALPVVAEAILTAARRFGRQVDDQTLLVVRRL